MTNTRDFKQTWETYASSWKTSDPDEKRRLYEASLSPDCVYSDPLTQAKGWDELLAYMVKFHEQIPGGHFVTIEFMTHHDRSLAKWNMVDAQGTVLGDGVSYGEYDADGKLVSMNGFFETPNA